MSVLSVPAPLPGLTPDEIAMIKSIIGNDFEIFIFGSRATGKHRPFSDVDICLKGSARIDDEVIAALRFAFQDSDLRYQVDLVDALAISPDFRALIEKTSVRI